MDKGIRQFVVRKFAELLPLRNAQPADSKTRDKEFRKNVMLAAMEEFDCTIPSAATHYNYALKKAQKEFPALVQGLGRPPEKNNGGRKKKVAESVADENDTVNRDAEIPEDAVGETEAPFAYTTVEPAMFVVKKKKDGTVVAEGLSLTAAMELVAAAKAAKKATLIWE